MRVRKLVLFLLLLTILLTPCIGYGENNGPKVYLIVMNKITLEDIKSMYEVQTIVKEGSIGLMNTRGVSGYTGIESFLTINSSRKTYGDYTSSEFYKNELDNSIQNYSLSRIINSNKSNKYAPYIGAIGDNLHSKGLKTAIYGNSDLIDLESKDAALIPMDSKGLVDYGNIDDITINEKEYPFAIKTDYTKLLSEIDNSPADFIVVDTGDLERLYRYRDNIYELEYKSIRQKILKDIDSFMKNLINIIDHENSLMIITSPNNGDINIDDSKLSPIVIWGKGIEKGSMISSTTDRQDIVANIDIGPTIMKFLGLPMDNMSGKPINIIGKNNNIEDIIQENQQINTISKARYKTLLCYGIISMVILFIPMILLLSKVKVSKKINEIIRLLLIMLFIFPINLIIASIFKPTNMQSYIIILLGLTLLSLILIWNTKKYKDQILFISLFCAILIILDLIFKGKISRYSVLSHDPIIGARYYGIGNEIVGLFLGYLSVFTNLILKKKNKSIIPIIIFIISIGLVSHPSMGANVGGTMAFLIATIFYIIEFLEKDINYKKLSMIMIIVIVFIAIMGYIDIKNNENTTHLGNTILLIKDNGLSYLNDIILRKVLMNIKLIGTSFWTYLLLLHMFSYAVIFNLYKDIDDKISIGTIAGIMGAIGGFLLNDSGIILAALCMNIITLEIYLKDI